MRAAQCHPPVFNSTFNIQHSTFDIQHSTFNIQHSTLNIQHCRSPYHPSPFTLHSSLHSSLFTLHSSPAAPINERRLPSLLVPPQPAPPDDVGPADTVATARAVAARGPHHAG